jgi:hypothetical protein
MADLRHVDLPMDILDPTVLLAHMDHLVRMVLLDYMVLLVHMDHMDLPVHMDLQDFLDRQVLTVLQANMVPQVHMVPLS